MRRIVSCETPYSCATARSGSLFSTTRCMISGQSSVGIPYLGCFGPGRRLLTILSASVVFSIGVEHGSRTLSFLEKSQRSPVRSGSYSRLRQSRVTRNEWCALCF
jgi:hypothetical protein